MSTKNVVHEYFCISFPVLVSDSLLGIGYSAIAVVMGHIGSDFVVANAIVSTVMHLSVIVIQGVSQAGSTITGITLGEGNTEKAQSQGYVFTVLGVLIGLAGSMVILSLSHVIIGLYQVTDATKALAEELMRAVAITIFFLWACSIPLGILSGLVLHWTGFWIYIMLRIDQFIKVILCIFRLKSGKWIKKIERLD